MAIYRLKDVLCCNHIKFDFNNPDDQRLHLSYGKNNGEGKAFAQICKVEDSLGVKREKAFGCQAIHEWHEFAKRRKIGVMVQDREKVYDLQVNILVQIFCEKGAMVLHPLR